jgi:hypothetical protein
MKAAIEVQRALEQGTTPRGKIPKGKRAVVKPRRLELAFPAFQARLLELGVGWLSIEQQRVIFDTIDFDRSGTITEEELQRIHQLRAELESEREKTLEAEREARNAAEVEAAAKAAAAAAAEEAERQRQLEASQAAHAAKLKAAKKQERKHRKDILKSQGSSKSIHSSDCSEDSESLEDILNTLSGEGKDASGACLDKVHVAPAVPESLNEGGSPSGGNGALQSDIVQEAHAKEESPHDGSIGDSVVASVSAEPQKGVEQPYEKSKESTVKAPAPVEAPAGTEDADLAGPTGPNEESGMQAFSALGATSQSYPLADQSTDSAVQATSSPKASPKGTNTPLIKPDDQIQDSRMRSPLKTEDAVSEGPEPYSASHPASPIGSEGSGVDVDQQSLKSVHDSD